VDHDPLSALRLVGVLWMFFDRGASAAEGRQWAQAALAAAEAAPGAAEPAFQAARARALLGQAFLAQQRGDYPAALAAATASMALARQVDAPRTLAQALAIGVIVTAIWAIWPRPRPGRKKAWP
jgi:hypothetical protein